MAPRKLLSPVELTEKKERRKARNKELQRECRQRKKIQWQQMVSQIINLRKENEQLRRENKQLQENAKYWRERNEDPIAVSFEHPILNNNPECDSSSLSNSTAFNIDEYFDYVLETLTRVN